MFLPKFYHFFFYKMYKIYTPDFGSLRSVCLALRTPNNNKIFYKKKHTNKCYKTPLKRAYFCP